MRISDWSSDVCSSDLPQAVISTRNQTVMPVTTSTADLRDGDKTVMAQRVIVLLDRLSRLTRELQFVDGLNPAQWEALRFLATANKYSRRSEEHTSELQSLMRISYAVFCLKKTP